MKQEGGATNTNPPVVNGQEDDDNDDSDWILLKDGALKGVNIVVDNATGDVTMLSTRFCRDTDRWNPDMPSLAEFPSLLTLDLHSSRYLVKLNESVASLTSVRRLDLR